MRWSVSADRAVRRCERQVFYSQVLASHSSSDPLRREVFVLKKLVRQEMWQGSVVHRVLETRVMPALQTGQTSIDVDGLTAAAVDLGRRQLAFSAAGRYRTTSKAEAGDDFAALYGHEYGPPPEDDALDLLGSVARTCFTNLAERPKLLKHLARATRLESERTLPVNIAGVTVTAKPDVIAIYTGQRATILDWKISASITATNVTQLLVYALAVIKANAFGALDPEAVRLVEANLLMDEIRSITVTLESLDETEDLIYRSGSRLRSALAVPHGEDLLDHLSQLQPASSPGTCALCNFRSVCVASCATAPAPRAPVQGTLL